MALGEPLSGAGLNRRGPEPDTHGNARSLSRRCAGMSFQKASPTIPVSNSGAAGTKWWPVQRKNASSHSPSGVRRGSQNALTVVSEATGVSCARPLATHGCTPAHGHGDGDRNSLQSRLGRVGHSEWRGDRGGGTQTHRDGKSPWSVAWASSGGGPPSARGRDILQNPPEALVAGRAAGASACGPARDTWRVGGRRASRRTHAHAASLGSCVEYGEGAQHGSASPPDGTPRSPPPQKPPSMAPRHMVSARPA